MTMVAFGPVIRGHYGINYMKLKKTSIALVLLFVASCSQSLIVKINEESSGELTGPNLFIQVNDVEFPLEKKEKETIESIAKKYFVKKGFNITSVESEAHTLIFLYPMIQQKTEEKQKDYHYLYIYGYTTEFGKRWNLLFKGHVLLNDYWSRNYKEHYLRKFFKNDEMLKEALTKYFNRTHLKGVNKAPEATSEKLPGCFYSIGFNYNNQKGKLIITDLGPLGAKNGFRIGDEVLTWEA